jgi:hypothetical protein
MGIKVSNNAFATLAAGITNSATSITLTTGQGARFPTLGAGDYFYATLIDISNNLEIVKCTARSTDVLTVVRAQESTTARAYSTGDRIEIRITAQTFADATAITPAAVSDQANTSTGYFALPVGTTAQRPGTPASGMIRQNSTTNEPEWYDAVGGVWVKFADTAFYQVEYLVVAGGGGGATSGGGGGGAGGYRSSVTGESSGGGASAESLLTLNRTTSYTVTVGGGGTGFSGSSGPGANGSNSVFGTVTSTGGGGGGVFNSTAGGSGGSGGGGSGSAAGGSGTSGQGFSGGSGAGGEGAGGGGAGQVGGNSTVGTTGGNGGNGVASSITGSSTTRGGGGGGRGNATAGSGGSGGGGNAIVTGTASSGTANTGGGGGGAGGGGTGGNGGSGIVIIRYAGSQRGTGGTVTSSGGFTIHTFTSSGTYTA